MDDRHVVVGGDADFQPARIAMLLSSGPEETGHAMADIPLQKRPYDLFVSYGHADKGLVDPVVDLFSRDIGLNVWYDASSGDASKRTSVLLSNAIGASRGAMFFLSEAWLASSWCQDEHDTALTERREDDQFLILAARIDDCELPKWFKIANVLDFRAPTAAEIAGLLRSLSPNPPSRLDAAQDIYLSAPWSRPSEATDATVQRIASMGWRLVGDAPNLPHFREGRERIASIIDTSRGVVVVMPYYDNKPPPHTSPWIMDEAWIAQECGRPLIIFAEPGVEVPDELVRATWIGNVVRIGEQAGDAAVRQALNELDEELARAAFRDAGTYVFLATSLLGDANETDDLVSVIQRACNMPCFLGQRLGGQHVQQAIVDRIGDAAVVIADVTNNHFNTLIETGVAIGKGTPLHLMSKIPDDGSRKRRFMFEDMEMNWYETVAERLATAYRLAKPYRRRIYFPT